MADSQLPSHRSHEQATSAAAEPATSGASAASFGRLATRITGWTSNLVATVIVVLVCLGVGHTLLDWSGRDEPLASVAPGGANVTSTAPGDVEFPVAEGLKRLPVSGDREAVRAALRQRIERATRQLVADRERLKAAASRTPSPSEARLLELTANRKTAAAELGQWELHEFIGTFPLWVGFVHVPGNAGAENDQPTESSAPITNRRLVAWGMAVPAADNQWNLYLQDGGTPHLAASPSITVEPPLPPGCHRTLALSDEAGQRLIGFAGQVAIDDCRRHFDHWAKSLAPPRQLAWQGVPGNWRAEVNLPASVNHPSAAAPAGHRIQLQLATDARQAVLGLIVIAPLAKAKERQP